MGHSAVAMMVASVLFLAASAVGLQDVAIKTRPVSKVVTLLKDMSTQLSKEAEQDEEVYEVMGCWCETNDKEKTKAISDAKQRIQDKTASIEELSAKSSQLHTQLENLNKEVAANIKALDQATALRKKQLEAFHNEEKDMLQSIGALKSAVVVIGKQHAAEALLQDSATAIDIAQLITRELHKHKSLLAEVITPSEKRAAARFAKAPEAFLQGGDPASGEIFGILKTMKETFSNNLATSQKEETSNQRAYEDLKAAKTDEITAGQNQIDTKTTEKASANEKLAVDKQDLEDTSKGLAADTKFLISLKEQCATLDHEYEVRVAARQGEIHAVSKALEILNGDDAHDLFSKTLNFVQLSSERRAESEARHMRKFLRSVALRTGDPRLAAISVKVRIDAFGKVKVYIQDLIDQLAKEKKDEINHKDFCIEELNKNERDTELKEREKEGEEAHIDDLKLTIEESTKAIEELKGEIAEMQVQMKRAGEDREKENKDFQLTIADQRATQKLIGAAIGVLEGFYNKAALVQVPKVALAAQASKASKHASAQAPPAEFAKPKSSGSGGVIGMLKTILNDAKAMEKEALHDETSAQTAYEEFVKETNAAIEEKLKDQVNKRSVKAKAEGDLVKTKQVKDSIVGELEHLYAANADLHKACDFVVKNFDIRQSSRDEEIEALKQTLAMLSGASFGAFLEDKKV